MNAVRSIFALSIMGSTGQLYHATFFVSSAMRRGEDLIFVPFRFFPRYRLVLCHPLLDFGAGMTGARPFVFAPLRYYDNSEGG